MKFENDDPVSAISAKVRNEVDRVATSKEVEHNRRTRDQVDSWLKTIVPIFLSAAIMSLYYLSSTLGKHDININDLTVKSEKMEEEVERLKSACATIQAEAKVRNQMAGNVPIEGNVDNGDKNKIKPKRGR